MIPFARRVVLPALLSLSFAPPALAAEPVHVAVGDRSAPVPRGAIPAELAQRLERSGKRLQLVDLTAPGATAAEVRTQQLPRAMALRPMVVTVAIGSADVCGSTPLRSFARDLEIIADLLRRNATAVSISTIPAPAGACALSPRALQARLDAFNATIARTAERQGLAVAEPRGAEGPAASLEPAAAHDKDLAPAATASGRRTADAGSRDRM